MSSRVVRWIGFRVLLVCMVAVTTGVAVADGPLNDDGQLIDFGRDIAPIFVGRCLECHGNDDAKNGFRIDDPESVADYIEGGDHESSSLYVDYLVTEDEDLLMPPASHGGPLSASELALVRVWIDEGADWPSDAEVASLTESVREIVAEPPSGLVERVWSAQGYLHPATVHFPIALFLLGAGFVVAGWRWPAVGTQIPLACLLLGTASAIAASAMGWAFAVEQGYGGWDRFNASMMDREVFWHRWSAVIVTLIALVSSALAIRGLRKPSQDRSANWKIGLLICGLLVGLVGHQGGEMTYGEDFYPRAWRTLTGQPSPDADAAATVVDAKNEVQSLP